MNELTKFPIDLATPELKKFIATYNQNISTLTAKLSDLEIANSALEKRIEVLENGN